ncbi:hypothetical protein FD754_022642, partial [Muntiacus muntjak]
RIANRFTSQNGQELDKSTGETLQWSCQKDPKLVDKIMQDLDANKDNKVDFNEFVVMVAALTVACNDYFVEQLKKK